MSFSSIVVIPYNTTEDYQYIRLDTSLFKTNETLTVDPNSSLTYPISEPPLYVNASLVQISLTASGNLNVSLYNDLHPEYPDETTQLLLHGRIHGSRWGGDLFGKYWAIYYWTPPGPQWYSVDQPPSLDFEGWRYYDDLSFVFTNLEDAANKITFQVKVYFLKAIGEREVTSYRPMIDHWFFYAGISLIAVAVTLQSTFWLKYFHKFSYFHLRT